MNGNKMKLYPYQEKATDGILEFLWKEEVKQTALADQGIKLDHVPTVLLEAPTAAGKTIMAAGVMKKIGLKESFNANNTTLSFSSNYMFVFMTPNSLHIGSLEKFRKYGLPEEGFFITGLEGLVHSEPFPENTILASNYSSVNSADNVVIRENEQGTDLKTVMELTRKTGIKVILVIDEAHLFATSDKSEEIFREIIKPSAIIKITATPFTRKGNKIKEIERDFEVVVGREAIVSQGIIIKSTIVNQDYDEAGIELEKLIGRVPNDNERSIYAAILMREKLQERYENAGSNVNPLAMIQLPSKSKNYVEFSKKELKDSKEDDTIVEQCLAFIKEIRGYSLENGNKIAINLAERKENLANIEDNDSEQEILIFKAAIATGWDCPRASVMAMLRNSDTGPFPFQTVGRLSRQPELHHYDDEMLNHAYVYTPHELIKHLVEKGSGEVEFPKKTLPLNRFFDMEAVSQVAASSYAYQEKSDLEYPAKAMVESLKNSLFGNINIEDYADYKSMFEAAGFDVNTETTSTAIAGEVFDIDNFSDFENKTVAFKSNEESVQRKWDIFIAETLRPYGAIRDINNNVDLAFSTIVRVIQRKIDRTFSFGKLRNICVSTDANKGKIATAIDSMVAKKFSPQDLAQTIEAATLEWKPLPEQLYATEAGGKILGVPDPYYAYGEGLRTTLMDSEAEVKFASLMIPKMAQVAEEKGWNFFYYKETQPNNPGALAIPYFDTRSNKKRLLKPDFVIFLSKGDNVAMYISEVKSEDNPSKEVIDKATGLQDYLQNHESIGGTVVNMQGVKDDNTTAKAKDVLTGETCVGMFAQWLNLQS